MWNQARERLKSHHLHMKKAFQSTELKTSRKKLKYSLVSSSFVGIVNFGDIELAICNNHPFSDISPL